MFEYLKGSLNLYKNNFFRVLLIGFTIILPIQVIYTIVVNYISMPFFYFNIPIWPIIFQSLFMLMSLFIMLIPMVSIVVQGTRSERIKLGKVYGDTIRYAFFVYAVSIPVSIITTVGLFLLIVPGIFCLIFFIGIPLAKVIEDAPFLTIIKRSFAFGKENFLMICSFLLLFATVDFIGSFLLSFLALIVTGQMAVMNWMLMLFNTFLLPLFIFIISKVYLDWNGEADYAHDKDYDYQLELYRQTSSLE